MYVDDFKLFGKSEKKNEDFETTNKNSELGM